MRLVPSTMPKARDQMVRLLTDPAGPLRSAFPAAEGLDRVANHLTVAELWWVSAEMTALAVSAADTLPEVRWTTADRPAPCGLLVWDGGLGWVGHQGMEMPIDAVSWGPCPDGLQVTVFVRRSGIDEALARDGRSLAHPLAPLVPVVGDVLPVSAEWIPADALNPGTRTLTTSLAATWLLAAQPALIERQQVPAERDIRRAYGRAGRGEPEVTLIELRRAYAPQQPAGDDGQGTGRRYRHRWVTRGHWRSQPHGPERSLRRQQWIPAHVKGPHGAPMLETIKVNVWRR